MHDRKLQIDKTIKYSSQITDLLTKLKTQIDLQIQIKMCDLIVEFSRKIINEAKEIKTDCNKKLINKVSKV